VVSGEGVAGFVGKPVHAAVQARAAIATATQKATEEVGAVVRRERDGRPFPARKIRNESSSLNFPILTQEDATRQDEIDHRLLLPDVSRTTEVS
jgi:hypothetical protein